MFFCYVVEFLRCNNPSRGYLPQIMNNSTFVPTCANYIDLLNRLIRFLIKNEQNWYILLRCVLLRRRIARVSIHGDNVLEVP